MCRNEADRADGWRIARLLRAGGAAALRRIPRRAIVFAALSAALSTAGLAVPAAAQTETPAVVSSRHATGVELSAPSQQILQQLEEQWTQWLSAATPERAEQVVGNLLTTAGQLGMRRLPDLSLAALVQARRAAERNDFRRAHWALAGAERLDPGRAETSFATATVDALEGSYLSAFAHKLVGYQRLFALPKERYLWFQSLLPWSLFVLLLTGGCFLAVQMATKGGALYQDLTLLVGRRLPGSAGLTAAIVLLVWPVILPYGPLWLLVYWSILLWGYASLSERLVIAALWLLLGVSPLLLGMQRRHLSLDLSPPVQAMENLAQKRLYGNLFTDLGVLRSILPDSPAVKQLLADLHRMMNQWDLARSLYRQVLEKEPANSSALLSVGNYFFVKGDYGPAVQFYQKAAEADSTSAVAQYNLSQAYAVSYQFDEQAQAAARARALDDRQVSEWLRQAGDQRIVFSDGGVARMAEIRQLLAQNFLRRESALSRPDVLRRNASLVFSLGLLLVAAGLHAGRRRFGYTEPPLEIRFGGGHANRWRRVLLPGLASAEAREGGRTYLALLPAVALLCLPFANTIGYRIPWGYDPGSALLWMLSILGLLGYFGARLRWELTHQV